MTTRAYYNEFDKATAAWLRELIYAGVVAPGDVDDRDIRDVRASDLAGYAQCHFFAGVGVWSYALRLARWPDSREVWTGSCPCQPFSNAGKRKGASDERHVWPEFARLIGECCPAVVLGEQVASADGRTWLSAVRADLEGMAYGVGAADLCAAGVGGPHIRQRLWWGGKLQHGVGSPLRYDADGCGSLCRLGDSDVAGLEGRRDGKRHATNEHIPCAPSVVGSPWDNAVYLPCTDGKSRPVEPSTFPLVDGAPARVVRLRGYGNAIVAPLAEVWIRAFSAATDDAGVECG